MKLKPWQVVLTNKGLEYLGKYGWNPNIDETLHTSDKIANALKIIEDGGDEWSYDEFAGNYPVEKLIRSGYVRVGSLDEITEEVISLTNRIDPGFSRILKDYVDMANGKRLDEETLDKNLLIIKDLARRNSDSRFDDILDEVFKKSRTDKAIAFDMAMSVLHDTNSIYLGTGEDFVGHSAWNKIRKIFNILEEGDIHDDAGQWEERTLATDYVRRLRGD